MAEDNRLYELIGEMLIEQRKTNSELKQMREEFTSRTERLEEQQKKTNVLLQQHTQDLMRIADSLDKHVVHWGDKATLRTRAKKFSGIIERTE